MNDKSYRKNVGLIVLDQNNQLLICRRKGKKTWQFPLGGIDADESPIQAAYRELYEEVGIKKNQVKVIQKSKYWYRYDLPGKYKPWPKSLKNFKGQTQKWFMLKANAELEINLLNEVPQEFVEYKWSAYWHALASVVPFKQDVYRNVLSEFLPAYIQLHND
jgi:putative (di)nucleoside polyphosphate hydrolase